MKNGCKFADLCVLLPIPKKVEVKQTNKPQKFEIETKADESGGQVQSGVTNKSRAQPDAFKCRVAHTHTPTHTQTDKPTDRRTDTETESTGSTK